MEQPGTEVGEFITHSTHMTNSKLTGTLTFYKADMFCQDKNPGAFERNGWNRREIGQREHRSKRQGVEEEA